MIEPVGGHGGMNYYNSGLCNALQLHGGNAFLYTSAETKFEHSDKFNIHRNFVGIYGRGMKVVRAFKYLHGLFSSVLDMKSRGAGFCHLHFFHYAYMELITCAIIRVFGLKIIATVHDVESFSNGSSRRISKYIFMLVGDLIVHNDFSRKEVFRLLQELGVSREINVIPHGNYLPYIKLASSDDSRAKLGLSKDSKVILFFGQIKKVKGLDFLISAMPKILESQPDAVLLIAGKVWKDDFDSYQVIIDELGLHDTVVKHVRYIDDSLVDHYYSAADLVVLPYRKIYQSGVLLMAMSYGAVTLSSRLEPMQEVVDDGVDGFLFEPSSSDNLAEVALAALKNSAGVGDRARRKMQSDYSWAEIAQKHMEVYKKYVS